MLMIKNIDLYVQIPGLSRTSTKIPGLSRPGIQILKFKDFPGFQGPVIIIIILLEEILNNLFCADRFLKLSHFY